MNHAIAQLGEFGVVPAVGSTHQIPRYTLQLVDIVAAALRTRGQIFGGVLVTAVHAAVAVMVHRTVTYVVLVHQIDDIHDRLRIVRRVTVDLDIEYVSAARERVIGSLHLGLVFGRAAIIDGHVVRIGIINLVGNTFQLAEILAVAARELARQTLGGGGQHAEVMAVTLRELGRAVAHAAYYFES